MLPKSVLFIAPLPPPYGGISNWTSMIVRHLQATGCSVDVVNTAPMRRITEGRSTFNRVTRGILSIFKTCSEAEQRVKVAKYEVAHIATSASLALFRDIAVLKMLKRNNIPCILHLHFGRTPELSRQNNWEWRLLKKAIGLSDVVLTMDEPSRQVISNMSNHYHVRNIENPVELSSMPLPVSGSYEGKTILFVGWVVESKGICELLSAWEALYSKEADWRLQVIGPISKEMREVVENTVLPRIEINGEVDHRKALEAISACDILCLPSYTEGFPNVILEAMCYSKAVVATNVGAIPEMLADDRGVVVQAKDSKQLEEALRSLMEDEEKRIAMGEKGHKYAVEECAVEAVVHKYSLEWAYAKANRGNHADSR